jgi:transcriptional regulator with GAF, ATPase, and Fis domain
MSPAALARLEGYGFPGNVRELKTTIERAAYRERDGVVDLDDIELPEPSGARGSAGFEERLEAFKRRLVQDALTKAGGSQIRAARSLGLTYDQLRYYVRKFGPGARAIGEGRPRRPKPGAKARRRAR